MRFSITLLLCLFLAAVAAGPTDAASPGFAPSGVCVFGNYQTLFTQTDYDWIIGGQMFAVPFAADQPTCGCADGFKLETVRMVLVFGPEDVPATLNVSASLLETTTDGEGCTGPGEEIYRTSPQTVTVGNPGVHTIVVPVDPEAVSCARFGYDYAVSMNIHTRIDEGNRPHFAMERVPPAGCKTFVTFDNGGLWWDTVQFGFADFIVYADIVCCSGAVPAEEKSWGAVKSMFR